MAGKGIEDGDDIVEEAVAKVHEIVDLLEDALHKTMVSAFNPKMNGPRRMSQSAWHKLADKIIKFAMEDS